MKDYNPSMLIESWKRLETEEKIEFLEYLVSELEKGSKDYAISEYLEIFLLTIFLNTKRVDILKEEEEVYSDPSSKEEESKEIVSNERVAYILEIIANAVVRLHLPWQETFEAKLTAPIKAEDSFEYYFYKDCLQARDRLITFIKARELG